MSNLWWKHVVAKWTFPHFSALCPVLLDFQKRRRYESWTKVSDLNRNDSHRCIFITQFFQRCFCSDLEKVVETVGIWPPKKHVILIFKKQQVNQHCFFWIHMLVFKGLFVCSHTFHTFSGAGDEVGQLEWRIKAVSNTPWKMNMEPKVMEVDGRWFVNFQLGCFFGSNVTFRGVFASRKRRVWVQLTNVSMTTLNCR